MKKGMFTCLVVIMAVATITDKNGKQREETYYEVN